MAKPLNLQAGEVYGRLTVINFAGMGDRGKMYLCKCSCGAEKVVSGTRLRCKRLRSCGCLQKEQAIIGTRISNSRHGLAGTLEYNSWVNMVQRCHNPEEAAYKNYGARGIIVCDRWRKSVLAFVEDMGPRPSTQYSIERLNNDGNYEPSNCVWATRKEQNNNSRNNRWLTFDGKTRTLTEWANLLGIHTSTLIYRLDKWTTERSLTAPPSQRHVDVHRKGRSVCLTSK